jgi:hypothetical protein
MLLCCISCFFKLYVHVYAYLRVVLPFLVYCDVAIRLLYFTNRHMYIYIYIYISLGGCPVLFVHCTHTFEGSVEKNQKRNRSQTRSGLSQTGSGWCFRLGGVTFSRSRGLLTTAGRKTTKLTMYVVAFLGVASFCERRIQCTT